MFDRFKNWNVIYDARAGASPAPTIKILYENMLKIGDFIDQFYRLEWILFPAFNFLSRNKASK